jgi:hypothetical protein
MKNPLFLFCSQPNDHFAAACIFAPYGLAQIKEKLYIPVNHASGRHGNNFGRSQANTSRYLLGRTAEMTAPAP